LHYGGGAVNKPAIIKIYPTATPAAGTNIRIYIAPVKNNGSTGAKNTVVLSHRRKCRDDGYMCAISESSDFYTVQDTSGSSSVNWTPNYSLGTLLATN